MENKVECFIRKNTPELRSKLEDLGFYICPCVNFKNSVWLSTCKTSLDEDNPKKTSIHGIGYWDETYPCSTVEEALNFFLGENENTDNPDIDCGENEELFILLALYDLDESVYVSQCFWYEGSLVFCNSEDPSLICSRFDDNSIIKADPADLKKASVEELVKYFKSSKKDE